MNSFNEITLFKSIKEGNVKAFEKLFKAYYGYLCNYATRILNNPISAEEIVQDFFVKLWEHKTEITIETSVKTYFFRAVKNLCLNQIKHNAVKLQHAQNFINSSDTNIFNTNYIEVNLAADIAKCIEELPEKRREIFRLSREEGLKYREIAEKLNISMKTVETQMALAIKTLRERLKKYNTFLFYFFIHKAKKA